MIDTLEKCLEIDWVQKATYVEVRQHFGNSFIISLRDSEMDSSTGSTQGILVRALVDGAWGVSSSSKVTKKDINKAIKAAVDLASGISSKRKKKVVLAPIEPEETELIAPFEEDIRDHSIEEKVQEVVIASKEFEDVSSIKSFSVIYIESVGERAIVTTEGTKIHLKSMKPSMMAYCVAKEGGKAATGSEAFSMTGGWEIHERNPLHDVARQARDESIRLLNSKYISAGKQKVILDPSVCGLLAHEAVGHTAEADLVASGTFLTGRIGEQVASELISLVDEPFLDGCAAWVPYDSEAVKGIPAIILDKGILNTFMTDREMAAELDIPPTGNARAGSFLDSPVIRMRNTCFRSEQNLNEDELLEELKNGLILRGAESGEADSQGEMMFGIKEGLVIKDGELTGESRRGTTLTGSAFDILMSISGAGDDFRLDLGIGTCGKAGQTVPVDAGGPSLVCVAVLGGN